MMALVACKQSPHTLFDLCQTQCVVARGAKDRRGSRKNSCHPPNFGLLENCRNIV